MQAGVHVPGAPVLAPPAVPASAEPHPPGMVEALKEAFTADTAEREMRHSAELHGMRDAHAAELAARDAQTAAQLRAYLEKVAADVAARDEQFRGELRARHEAYIADVAKRDEHYAGQLRVLQQAYDEVRAQLTVAEAERVAETQARVAAETELQARRTQVVAQHLELESHAAAIAQLNARALEMSQELAAERDAVAQAQDRVQRLEAHLRDVVAASHQAALDAAGHLSNLHEAAVARGDHLVEQVELHEAAVNQLRATITQQRADREQLMEERQAARTRCVELESQLHALTADARHLAEGLQRVQAEREAERRFREAPEPEVTQPPRLRLAGTAETA